MLDSLTLRLALSGLTFRRRPLGWYLTSLLALSGLTFRRRPIGWYLTSPLALSFIRLVPDLAVGAIRSDLFFLVGASAGLTSSIIASLRIPRHEHYP